MTEETFTRKTEMRIVSAEGNYAIMLSHNMPELNIFQAVPISMAGTIEECVEEGKKLMKEMLQTLEELDLDEAREGMSKLTPEGEPNED